MPSRKRHSSGRLSAPVDVNSTSKIGKFESLIGPVLVFVYADWCGHCQRYKPMWKKLSQDPNRSINMAAVRDDMLPQTSLTERAEPVSSYPTVLLIGKNGKAVNFKGETGESQEVPDHGNMENMRAIIRNAGTEKGEVALAASSTTAVAEPVHRANEPLPSVNIRTNMPTNMNNRALPSKNTNTSTPNYTPTPNLVPNKKQFPVTVTATPSEPITPLNSVQNITAEVTPPPGPSAGPPNIAADIVQTKRLVKNQAGGSLFEILARTAYSAAPAAVLLGAHKMLTVQQRRGRSTRRQKRRSKKRASRKH